MNEARRKRLISNSLLAFLLGIPGFGISLGELGEGHTRLDWIFLVGFYFLFAGFLLGLVDVHYWYIAGLTVWGPLFVGGLILILRIGPNPFIPASLLVPLVCATGGGLLGAAVRIKIGAK